MLTLINTNRMLPVIGPIGLDCVAGSVRFFEPAVEVEREATEKGDTSNYNYNENLPLIEAIQKGARGAYRDILRGLRKAQ